MVPSQDSDADADARHADADIFPDTAPDLHTHTDGCPYTYL